MDNSQIAKWLKMEADGSESISFQAFLSKRKFALGLFEVSDWVPGATLPKTSCSQLLEILGEANFKEVLQEIQDYNSAILVGRKLTIKSAKPTFYIIEPLTSSTSGVHLPFHHTQNIMIGRESNEIYN